MRFLLIQFLLVAVVSCGYQSSQDYVKVEQPNFDSLDLANCLKEYFHHEGKSIDINLSFYTPKSDTIAITGYLCNDFTLILFLPRNTCTLCAYKLIDLLKNCLNKHNEHCASKILILSNMNPNRSLYVYWMDNIREIPFLLNKEFCLFPGFKNNDNPCFFTLDNRRVITNYFIPIIDNYKLTEEYLEIITSRL
jgi:hypothetical protein